VTFVRTSNLRSDSASRDESPAQKIARRLIESRQSERVRDDTAARAAAAACGYLYRDLARWVGHDGCHALFTRALAQSRTETPVLEQLQLHARSEPYLEGVAETIMAHGDAASADALESMLVHLIELLGRLIGDDMAMKLIERSLAAAERGGTTSNSKREEA
jgi:hypothetical protein